MTYSIWPKIYIKREMNDMKEVYIVRWLANRAISGVYADYKEACQVAEKRNKNRHWLHRALSDTKWVVHVFDVK